MKVFVVEHDPAWALDYDRESELVRVALGAAVHSMHHIGSTSVPGIYAKPIIDILVEATSLDVVDAHSPAMTALGFEAMGEFGIPGRRYFRRNDDRGVRVCHVHAFLVGSPGVERHLAFRDYLRSHPDVAQQYSDLKRDLARRHPADIEAYMDGKDAFIQETQRRALEWRSE